MKAIIFGFFMSIFLVIILIHVSVVAFAQDSDTPEIPEGNRPTNNFNLNLLGEGALISINFEKLFLIKPRFFLTGQAGLGYNEEFVIFGDGSAPERYLIIPHHITGNTGKSKHFFEFGLSGAIVAGETDTNYLLGPIIGYRVQPLNTKKVNFRVFGSIPFIGFNTDIAYVPVGISIGINLN